MTTTKTPEQEADELVEMFMGWPILKIKGKVWVVRFGPVG